ncbi:MAG: TlpA family protein disulfide reductase [Thermoplasmata archaeon]|nr:TlpA family protein disulfide reductase [Thermoplasmata archaeon]
MAKKKRCPICKQPIKPGNLEMHMRKVHHKKKVVRKKKVETKRTGKEKKKTPARRKKDTEGAISKRLLIAVAVIVAVIVIAATVIVLTLPGGEPPPNQAIDFTVTDTDGSTITLNNLKGEIVYLDFMAALCQECQDNTRDNLVPFYQSYSSSVTIISLSTVHVDTNQDLINYKLATGAQWQFAIDTDDAQGKFQVYNVPMGFLLNTNGVIVYSHIGPDSFSRLAQEVDKLLPGPPSYKDFTVTDTDGTTITISDWIGDVIYIDFFQSTCGYCIQNTENVLVPVYADYSGQIKIFAVSIRADDTIQDLLDFKVSTGATWQFALDTAGAASLYSVTGTPTGFLIDRNGNIAYTHVGADTIAVLSAEIDKVL